MMSQPVDSGYAWLILLGAFWNQAILVGVHKSLGILFVALSDHFHRSASATALFYPLVATASLATGPIITALAVRFSVRSVCMTGAVFSCLGMAVGYFARSLEAIIIPYGLIGGLGIGMVINPAPLIVSRYFVRRKSLAMGVLYAGTGLGAILLPPLFSALLQNYGLHHSILIIAALQLQTLIGSALYRPYDSWPAPEPRRTRLESDDDDMESVVSRRSVTLSASSLDLPMLFIETQRSYHYESSLPPIPEAGGEKAVMVEGRRPERMFHWELLREPPFLLFTLSCFCGVSAFYWTMLTPAYAESELGLGSEKAAWLLSIMGVGDLGGRLLVALAADRFTTHQKIVAIATSLLILGLSVLLSPSLTHFWPQVVVLVMGSCCFGVFISIGPVVLGEVVSVERLPSAWGLVLAFEGLSEILTPIGIATLRDHSGSYYPGYLLVGSATIIASAAATATYAVKSVHFYI